MVYPPKRNGFRATAHCLGWLLVAGLALVTAPPGRAQTPPTEEPSATYSFDTWTTEDGLPINWIYAIEQTRDGYLWLATGAGVARFDGLRFTAFDQSNTPALGNNEIRALYETADGTLWIGGQGGLTAYRDGHFERYNEESLYVNEIKEDREGRLWFIAREGVFKVEGDRLMPVPESAWRAPVTAEAVDARAGILLGYGSTMLYLDRGGGSPIDLPPALMALPRMIIDHQGHLITSTMNGLWRYETGTWKPLPAAQPLPNVTALYEDRKGTLWIGTQTGRLVRWERTTLTQELTLDHPIMALYEDREGNLWIGTSGSGLFRRKAATKFTTYTPRDGLPDDLIWTIYEDQTGTRWFGTDNGLSRYRDGRYTTFTERDGLPDNRVFSLYEDRVGTLWVGTNNGLASYRDGQFTRYPPHDAAGSGVKTPIRGSILEDRTGTLWAATSRGPARLIDGMLTLFDPGAHGQGDRLNMRDLYEDDQGTLWMGMPHGVLRYADGTFEHLTPTTTGDGTPGGFVQAFHLDETGALWMTTRGQGLVRYRDGRFHTLTTAHGLFDDIIHHLVEDDQGWFWMTTNRGIFRVRQDELHAVADGTAPFVTSVVYGTADGLVSLENNSGFPGPWKSNDGRFWFPTMKGVAVIDPNNFQRNEVPPPVVIEELLVDYQPVPLDAEIALPPETRGLAVTYTGLSLTAPDKVHFRYRLDGFDTEWVDAGGRRTAFYTNIPPGAYTFRVEAANNDGVWNETGASVSFVLKPHFYEMPWFYGLIGLVVLLVGVAGYRYRLRQLRERELVALVEERTAGLQAEKQKTEAQAQKLAEMDTFKTRFFANLSHELRTPLTLTIGPLEYLSRNPETPVTPAHLHGPLRNARRLLTLINQLLDIAKLEAGKMTLRACEQDLVAFARTRTETFASLAERKQIHLHFQAATDALPVYFEADKLEKVIYNLISNAIKYTPAQGKIHVAVAEQRRTAVITVKDTGTGIPKAEVPYVFDRFFQVEDTMERRPASTGIGLSLAKELVDLHGGVIRVESDVGFGSTFTVSLPLGRTHLDDGDVAEEPENGRTGARGREGEGEEIIEEEPVDDATPALAGAPARETILIVEDNAEMRAFIAGPLAEHYAVLEAADGVTGLDLACEQVPDLIVSDVMMPEMDGFTLCRALKTDERTSHIPVILLTARAGDESKIKGLETGADAYLDKPFNARELQVRVEQLIAQRKRLRARFSQGRLVLQPTDLGVTSADEAFLARALAAIEEHMAENGFGVFELADALGLSRRQLHRKLTALTGYGPADFLRQLRLERAGQLLRQDYGTVAEVAYQVGFNKPKHFSRLFRDHFGVNPSAYDGSDDGAA